MVALPVPPHKNADEMIELINGFLQQKRDEPFCILKSSANTAIPIALARDIKTRLSRRAEPGLTRVAVFYGMEYMKASSADALLKLIEEPPPNTVLLLTTSNPEVLLPTILSRSQKIRLFHSPEGACNDYLTVRRGINPDRARLVCRISRGNVGRAVELADEMTSGEDSRRADGFLLFKSLLSDSKPVSVSLMADLISGNDRSLPKDILILWQSLLRDCTYYAVTGDAQGLINVDFTHELIRLSTCFRDSRIARRWVALIKNTLADLYLNVHIQAALVALILRMKDSLPQVP